MDGFTMRDSMTWFKKSEKDLLVDVSQLKGGK
jgi:hypothetical protein